MKVYWKYSSSEELQPCRGDHITEINTIKAVSKFAEVIYGGIPPDDCDIYYLRAAPKMLEYISDDKPVIYFASPYVKECYDRANMISTFTDAWTQRLIDGTTTFGFPPDLTHHNPQTIHQTIDPMFKSYKDDPKTKEIRKKMGGEFIIGHFGSVRAGSHPHFLLNMISELKRRYPKISIVFAGDGIEHPHIKKMSFDYDDMPYALSACDLVMYNVWRDSGNIGGSLKILESMACGTPVICPRFDARVEELGEDYPLFYDWTDRNFGSLEMMYKIVNYMKYKDKYEYLQYEMMKRSKFYSVEKSANRIKKLFRRLIDETS